MNVVAEVRDEGELGRIVGFIHDQRFEIERLTYAPELRTLRLPFEKEDRGNLGARGYQLLFHRWLLPIHEHILEIRNTKSYSTNDSAQIRSYTFNVMQYDAKKREIRILACEDLQVAVEVADLDVAILATGKNLGVRRCWTILGCEIS